MVALQVSLPFFFTSCLCSKGCSSFSKRYLHQHHLYHFGVPSPHRHGLTLCLGDSLFPGLANGSNGHRDQIFQGWDSEEVTKFIDNNLTNAVMQKDGRIRQIVLLTDGTDQRPYRLSWPPSTLIFHVSSGPVFKPVKGAELPKNCLFRHVSIDFGEAADLEEGWTERLRRVGYQGDKPSIWAMQGLEHLRPSAFHYVLISMSRAAMKGSLFVGELPITAIDCPDEGTAREWLEKKILSHGFSLKFISFKQLAQGGDEADGVYARIFFLAEQLRLSDEQVMRAMREIELAEEAGDEETFEDW